MPKERKAKKSVRFQESSTDQVCEDSLPTKDEDQKEEEYDDEYDDEEEGSQSKEEGENSSV